MSEIIQICLKKSSLQHFRPSDMFFFLSIRVLMITWHLWAAVSRGDGYKQ